MNQVHLLIKTLAADYVTNDVDSLAKTAYQIASHGKYAFYESFYERFFANEKDDRLRRMFPPDMSRQHRMLDDAVAQLLNFRRQQFEPTTLTRLVATHKDRGLSKRDFEKFGEALIETFDASLAQTPNGQRMMAALEIVIWPGVDYMAQQCTSKPKESRPN
jgi:truncated hemoglobin YjbI